jgi:toxin-antitoxin system PIN domain toxin
VILLDANILLYAYNADALEHAPAVRWVEDVFSGSEVVALPWITLWAFLRISTNARAWQNPKPAAEAFEIVRGWLEEPNVVVVQPGPRHMELVEKMVVDHRAAGPLLTGAALAALALENGAVLASTDQDFSRFTALRWINPLAPQSRR